MCCESCHYPIQIDILEEWLHCAKKLADGGVHTIDLNRFEADNVVRQFRCRKWVLGADIAKQNIPAPFVQPELAQCTEFDVPDLVEFQRQFLSVLQRKPVEAISPYIRAKFD